MFQHCEKVKIYGYHLLSREGESMRIGVIGCGNIAHIISEKIKIHACYDIYPEKCKCLNAKICGSIEELVNESDIIVEAASVEAVREYAKYVLSRGKDMIIMSVGALTDAEFRREIEEIARKNDAHIFLTSGAIGGVDLIKSARMMHIDKITLKSYKSASSLGMNLAKRELIFRGRASEAIRKFPKSVNVAVLLSIVSGKDIEIEVYADPEIDSNIHVIEVSGEFGMAKFEIRNKPSKDNPKTSYLAALSLLEAINSLNDVIRVI